MLFIDSSHMIGPRGDVDFEYLEILPMPKAGVIVHVHDIFSPRDYPVNGSSTGCGSGMSSTCWRPS